jgi:hypothetical protein
MPTIKRISFTIDFELYAKFACYCAAKRIPIERAFRAALADFAITAPEEDAEIEAKFEELRAKAQAQQSIDELPELSGGSKPGSLVN